MTGEVIKQFLVGLGFSVDSASLAKFDKSIKSATLRVGALYGSIKLMAGAVTAALIKMSEGFEQLGYEYRIISPAINKALVLRREMLKAYSAAGINITKVVQASVKLNMSIAKTKFALEAIYKSVGSRFFEYLTKQSDIFRKRIYENMPKIQNSLERFVKFIFKALEATTALGLRAWSILTRVYDFFAMLHKATDGWSTAILGVVVAWKALNLAFLATPLGMILTGLLALLALYDDFKVWEEGGKSFFNWGPVVPVINSISYAIEKLGAAIGDVIDMILYLGKALGQVFKGNFAGAFESLKTSMGSILKMAGNLGESYKGVASGLGSAIGAASNYVLGNQPAGGPVNQNLKQQTNINVVSSADAQSVGKAVAGEQTRVNFDMVRNMKGATR